jgi:CheY-like chemotaxis protein
VIEAERVLVESRPDAILLDIGLPGIDGIFYLERLRETPQTSKIPIVAISGSEEAGRSARAVGAEAFLRKPFSPLELIALVTPLIRRAGIGQMDIGRDVVDAADLNRLIEIGRRQHQLLSEAYAQTVRCSRRRSSPATSGRAGTRAGSPRTPRGSRSRLRRGCSTTRASNGASCCTTSGRSASPTASSSSRAA